MSIVLIHPSSIGKIMTEPKPEAKKRGEVLSEGAKTYLKMLAKQLMYGFEQEIDVKYMRKGIMCEEDSIALLNTVLFKRYTKNATRVETDLMSGECDILQPEYIRDIKTAWSLATFPAVQEDAHDKDYEYQGRAYMHLYDRPKFYLDFCLVSTPEELCRYEQQELHQVDHIDPRLRVTTVSYERDMEIEARMLEKCRAAQKYIQEITWRIAEEHEVEMREAA
jgi:hypothetical protein